MARHNKASGTLRALTLSSCAALALGWAAPAFAQAAASTQSIEFQIPAQSLETALSEFARQSGQQLLYSPSIVQNRNANAVIGAAEPSTALERLLDGSGLTYSRSRSGAILIQDPSGERVRSPTQLGAAEGAASSEEEIVVTAQKREQRLQDVPVPVSIVDANRLAETGAVRLEDYYARVPGLSLEVDGTRGAPILAIRGLLTGNFSNPTVGIVVDGAPFGASTFIGGGWLAPDIDPGDLERIEVLRGPQGTLYGASSLGGLINYVTRAPSTEGFSGRVQVGAEHVEHGEDTGASIRGAVNVPLSDTFAVRLSAFARATPGYVNNVQTGEDDVNDGESGGARLAALWRISPITSLQFSALSQTATLGGSPLIYEGPGLGPYDQSTTPQTGGYEKSVEQYTGALNTSIGDFDLTTIIAYGQNDSDYSIDLFGSDFRSRLATEKLSAEFRASVPITSSIDGLIGLFYTTEDSRFGSTIYSLDANGDHIAPTFDFASPTTYEEMAVFADLTFHLTERLNLQLGARGSHNEQRVDSITNGVESAPRAQSEESPFTYLVTPQYRVSDELMIYGRFASGYRAGGPNANFAALGAPSAYSSDTTATYEFGAKGSVLDRMLSYDLSIYSIDWQDVQLTVESTISPGSTYIANATSARSQGIELSVDLRPSAGTSISGWIGYNEAELSDDLPASSTVVGLDGDRLPFSSRTSANVSFEQEFPLSDAYAIFIGGSVSYVGEREGNFTASGARQHYDEYVRSDLRTGVRSDALALTLFVNNATDERGVLNAGVDAFPANSLSIIQPRTIGVSLSKSF